MKSLWLGKNKIEAITGLENLTALKQLDIQHNRLTTLGEGVRHLQQLEELYLAWNAIDSLQGLPDRLVAHPVAVVLHCGDECLNGTSAPSNLPMTLNDAREYVCTRGNVIVLHVLMRYARLSVPAQPGAEYRGLVEESHRQSGGRGTAPLVGGALAVLLPGEGPNRT
jgi:hypothetical protein